MGPAGSRTGGDKKTGSRCLSKVKPKEFAEGLDVRYKRKGGVKDGFRNAGPPSWRNGVAIYRNRKGFECSRGEGRVFLVWNGGEQEVLRIGWDGEVYLSSKGGCRLLCEYSAPKLRRKVC